MIFCFDCLLSYCWTFLYPAWTSVFVLDMLRTELIAGPRGVIACKPVIYETMSLLCETEGPILASPRVCPVVLLVCLRSVAYLSFSLCC